MAAERGHPIALDNETAINVAGLLQERTGSARRYALTLDRFPLDADLAARHVVGEIRLTRLRMAIMAHLRANGEVEVECARCLRLYPQPFAVEFDEEYRQTVDVRTGLGLAASADQDTDTSLIDENHELDLADVLRQEIVLALPMRPDCGEACPGPGSLLPVATDDSGIDGRFAALATLLGDGDQ